MLCNLCKFKDCIFFDSISISLGQWPSDDTMKSYSWFLPLTLAIKTNWCAHFALGCFLMALICEKSKWDSQEMPCKCLFMYVILPERNVKFQSWKIRPPYRHLPYFQTIWNLSVKDVFIWKRYICCLSLPIWVSLVLQA